MRWNAIAPLYDLQLALERPALTAALELAQPAAEDRVLDVATGTGAVLRMLTAQSPRPAEAVGVDSAAGMLARVPALPSGWRTVRADAAALPFPADRFDLVVCSYLLHLLEPPERHRVLEEIHRVLARTSRLVTVTPVAPPTPLGQALERVAGRRLLDPRADLEHAGFAIGETRYVRSGYPSLCVRATRGPGPAAVTQP